MWVYKSDRGEAKIIYDSLTGYFIACFESKCYGTKFFTPKEAVLALAAALRTPAFQIELPMDLALWTPTLQDFRPESYTFVDFVGRTSNES